ncbi:MAG: diaminopimelate decarboxylase [Alphaproteobacteria bacterium]|nr:diaminopimelate decarboxylase [Alphaproteobacteria bacterium]MBV9061381.1 diaminopimelate decarboxylase [Alphaproteobacteria bacterium]
MNPIVFRGSRLFAEDVDLASLAEHVGTPFYCYSTAVLEGNFRTFASAVPTGTLVAYAVKANGNLAVLRTLAKLGAGADVVSGGELKKALAAGIPPNKIVFSGVGKSAAELSLGLREQIFQFNVESEAELELLAKLATSARLTAPVALRINPDVDAQTHAKISTGTAETKFGIPLERAPEAYAAAARLAGIEVAAIHVHLGSQLTSLEPFERAFRRIGDLIPVLRKAGHRIERADLGGGIGAGTAAPDIVAYGGLVERFAREHRVSLVLEPGRVIAANAGVLIARVLYVKEGWRKRFAVIDAGMNDLLRPALYGAHHEIVSLRQSDEGSMETYDVVGPVCETSDTFGTYRLPPLHAGDLVAILMVGAYGAAMASAYNERSPAAEVLVRDSQWSLVRPRMNDDERLRLDRIPTWLE